MMKETLNVGLIGTGTIGRLHARHLACHIPQTNLLMASDINTESLERCVLECKIEQFDRDYHTILNHPDIQAVIICSSTDTHTQIIKEAAMAGKHIFCEKPIGFDLEEIDRALTAVKKADVLLQIGFNRRFDKNFRRVRKAVLNNEIGQPHLMHIISRDPAPPSLDYIKVSGGLFFDMTIHDFDMARYLLDDEVEEIYATGAVRIDPAIGEANDLDTALVVMKFTSGVIASIDNSRQAVYGYDQRVELFGSEGCINTANNFSNTALIQGKDKTYRDLPLNFYMERYQDSYLEEMKHFVKAVLANAPSPVSGVDGRISVVMAHMAKLSYQENWPLKIADFAEKKNDPHEYIVEELPVNPKKLLIR